MKTFILAIFTLTLLGCGSVLQTYEAPLTPNLAKLKLAKNSALLFKLGEVDDKGCATKMRTVREASYADGGFIPVQADRGVVLHVNGTGKTQCRGTKALSLEANKEYEALVQPFPFVCYVSVYEIKNGVKDKKIEAKGFRDGCVRE